MTEFLNPQEKSLGELLKDQYVIPVYQRPYSWGKSQVSQLLNDIDEAFNYYIRTDSKDIVEEDANLFIGTMFIMPDPNNSSLYGKYEVIDGQQRITTLLLLLMILLNQCHIIGTSSRLINEIKMLLWKIQEGRICSELRTLTLGNFDDVSLSYYLELLFRENNILEAAEKQIKKPANNAERTMLDNIILIGEHISVLNNEADLLNYFDFIKDNIKVITIRINTASDKLFSIFESINSKGKRLDEIDLIKSYIFQNLEHSDYQEYLEKWGRLIWDTEDRLDDYFITYIRANITFYKYDINLDRFKKLASGIFKDYYKKAGTGEALKAFIDDLTEQVRHYKMLSVFANYRANGISEKAESFFRMNHIAGYKTTRFFLFKLLALRNGYIEESIFDSLTAYGFAYAMTVRTIGNQKNEDTLNTFKEIHEVFKELTPTIDEKRVLGETEAARIVSIFKEAVYKEINSNTNLRDMIRGLRYIEHTRTNPLKIILSFLSTCNFDNTVNYSYLNTLLDKTKSFKIEPILPADPEDDNRYQYILRNGFYHFKKDQDFVGSSRQKIAEDAFLENYIYRFGNLRLNWASKTARMASSALHLNDITLRYTNKKQVDTREEMMIEKLVRSELVIRPDDYVPAVDLQPKSSEREITSSTYDKFHTANYRPVSFTLLGEKVELKKKTWNHLLTSVFDKLWETHRKELSVLARWGFPTYGNSNWLTNQREGLRKDHCLGESSEDSGKWIYIETHHNGAQILVFCFDILQELKIGKDDLSIVARRER